MIVRLQRSVLHTLVACLLLGAPLAPAQAAIVGTGAAMAMSERAEAVNRINGVFMREDVRNRLETLGVDPARALERVQALTDAELAELDERLETLPAGGSVLGILGAVLVVLIILELLGVTNVFTSL